MKKKIVLYKKCENPSVELSKKFNYVDELCNYIYIPSNNYEEPVVLDLDYSSNICLSKISQPTSILILQTFIKNAVNTMTNKYDNTIYLVPFDANGDSVENILRVPKDSTIGDAINIEDWLNNLDLDFYYDLFIIASNDNTYLERISDISNCIKDEEQDYNSSNTEICMGYVDDNIYIYTDTVLDLMSDNIIMFDSSIPRIFYDINNMPSYCIMDINTPSTRGPKSIDIDKLPRNIPVLLDTAKNIDLMTKHLHDGANYGYIGINEISRSHILFHALLNSLLITATKYGSELYMNKYPITKCGLIDAKNPDEFLDVIRKAISNYYGNIVPETIEMQIIKTNCSGFGSKFVTLASINPTLMVDSNSHKYIMRFNTDKLISIYDLPYYSEDPVYKNKIQIGSMMCDMLD